MRKYCNFIAAIGLIASPSAWAGSLAAGKPAGVHQAQMTTGSLVVAGGLSVIGIALIANAVSGGGSNNTSNQSNTTTTTTATTS